MTQGQHPPIALLRNVSVDRLIKALEHEGFQYTGRRGNQRVYRHPDHRRVVIHYHHSNDTIPPHVIRHLLVGTGWTEDDLRRLGLIT